MGIQKDKKQEVSEKRWNEDTKVKTLGVGCFFPKDSLFGCYYFLVWPRVNPYF